MSVLRRNVIANGLGQVIGILSGLILIPLYNRFLGAEGFGLVGFILSLQALTAILDLGMGAAANREVSRRSSTDGAATTAALVRTLEVMYCGMALALLAVLVMLSQRIEHDWIQADSMAPGTVAACVQIASITLALRLQSALYHGVLRGLERQVPLNLVYASVVALQTVGLALVLLLRRPALPEFFVWQAGFTLCEFLALRTMAWSEVRRGSHGAARFSGAIVREIWRFALSVNGITLFAAGIKQIDKIVISKLMPIASLGPYSAAALISNGIGKVAVPFQTALFPRYARLHATGETAQLATLFRTSVRLLSLLNCAVAAAIAFFAHDLLAVWLQSAQTAAQAAPALSILSAAMMLNGMMAPVFSLLLALGQTRIPLVMNAAGLVLLIPATLWLVRHHGLAGGATAWLAFNLAYYVVVPAWLSRRWQGFALGRFYVSDTLPFVVLSIGASALTSFVTAGWNSYARIVAAAIACAAVLAAGTRATADLRRLATSFVRRPVS